MDPRLDLAPVVQTFARMVRPVADVVGFYAGGSLAGGDFVPAVSDLDLVAVVAAELDDDRRQALRELHAALVRNDPSAVRLHCCYVPRDRVEDVSAAHLTWAHGELYRRPLSGIARAELLRGGITVLGPRPAQLLPPVGRVELQAAARGELSGYWSTAVRTPRLWLRDVYVDLGLLTLPRVQAALTEDRLISKSEALTRLPDFGVPPALMAEIAGRRQGEVVPLTPLQRVRRAARARRLCAVGIRRLLDRSP